MASKTSIILIVDDSATTRHMIKRVIGIAGLVVHQIEEAADGEAALAIMNSTPVDLVMADLNMPVMDGFEMIRRMHASESLRHIPVVVISAQPDTEQIAQLTKDGVRGYLPKPFTPEGVRNLVEPLLSSEEPRHCADHSNLSFNLNLAEALAEALETMAFISPEMQQGAATPRDARVVKVAFHGAGGTGCLILSAPRQFAALVAANCNAEPSDTEADDALKELANVTCGLLLRKRVGGAVGFKMSPPVLSIEADAESVWDADAVQFNAEGYPIVARVSSDWSNCVPAEVK
jgi:two-component system chemotaxis response regulator CheY